MDGIVNLNPEAGQELATILTSLMDGVILDVVQEGYQAARSLGDENNLVQGLTEKFMAFQAKYNEDVVPGSNKAKTHFEEFSDYAEYVKKLQIDSSVKDVEVGEVKPNNYDAAKNL